MSKTLVLIRHAHRERLLGPQVDNGLSDKGKKQAKEVAKYFHDYFDSSEATFLSSPKKRCMETIQAISDKVEVRDELGEGLGLRFRAQKFADWWRGPSASELTVACSHGDWIPECVQILTGAVIDIKKAGWVEIESVGTQVRLTWLIQDVVRKKRD